MNQNQSSPKIILFVTTLSAFLIPFMGSSINIALPTIGKEFSLTAITLSWVATSYLLSAAIFLLPLGKLSDIAGRRSIFLGGILIYTVSSLLSGLSQDVAMLIGCRVLQGFGGSMLFATGMAIVISSFPPEKRGKVLGINVAAVYFGLSAGPFIGGLITEFIGWRSIFYLNGVLGIISLWLGWSKLNHDSRPSEHAPFDITGTSVYSLSFIIFMYGASHLTETAGMIMLPAGVAGLILFFFIEMKTRHPLLNISAFKTNSVFIFSNAAALINYSATFAIGFLLSLYLQYMKDLSPQYAGYILVSQPLIMALLSPVAGKLSDRIEPRIVASAGMLLTIVGLIVFVFLDADTSLWMIITNLVLFGTGFALFSSPNTNAIMSSVDRSLYGVASAIVGTMRLTGQVVSMAIVTLIFSYHIGYAKPSAENLPQFMLSFRHIFIVFVILCVAGLWASMVRGNLRKKTDNEMPSEQNFSAKL